MYGCNYLSVLFPFFFHFFLSLLRGRKGVAGNAPTSTITGKRYPDPAHAVYRAAASAATSLLSLAVLGVPFASFLSVPISPQLKHFSSLHFFLFFSRHLIGLGCGKARPVAAVAKGKRKHSHSATHSAPHTHGHSVTQPHIDLVQLFKS